MELLEGLYSRRSVRNFTDEPVTEDQVTEILRAGSWAPSGLNNQPWRFVTVKDKEKRRELARLTKYGRIIEAAPVSIAVFCDREAMYNDTKDHQSMGACLQNMLLAAHGLGLGAVWLGEILKNAAEVRDLLELPVQMELMAVIAVGHPKEKNQSSSRRELKELLIREY
jgi:nitroreductase